MATLVKERLTVTLREAGDMILANPKGRVMLQGEPGIGKSSLIRYLEEKTGYPTAYIDVPNLDLGDGALPVPDHETKTTGFYPNKRFKLHQGKPVIIMLDEYTKGMDPVKNMLHPMLEVSNPRFGDIPIPEGSIVFLTGNLESDGVGDDMQAHTTMRLTKAEVSKPTADEWLPWAAGAGIHPVIMAWVNRTPQALASYRDGDQEGNEYIFNPNKVQGPVVTLRTLEMASDWVHQRDNLTPNALHVALAGCVGLSAAHSIMGFIRHHDSLPSWDSIMRDPGGAKLPEEGNAGAMAVLVFGAVERVASKDEVAAMLHYMDRSEEEWRILFITALAKSRKRDIAFTCKAFADRVVDLEDLL